MIDLYGTPAPTQAIADARRLRELAASLRARADRAERLLDVTRTLDTPATWQGTYPDQLRGTLRLLGERVANSANAIRERADFLETAAMDYEMACEMDCEPIAATSPLPATVSAAGSR